MGASTGLGSLTFNGGASFGLWPTSGFKMQSSYMPPICIMIGALTLFGNIFYGCYIRQMKNLQANNTSTTAVTNIGVNRVLSGNNDIEMKRLQ